jgi:glycosyltransferase involved in cell wall biosynthesis
MTRPRIAIDLAGLDRLWPGAGLFRYAVDLLHALHELAPPARFIVLGDFPEPVGDLKPIFQNDEAAWDYVHFPRATGFASSYRDHVRLSALLTRVRADLCHCLHMFAPVLAPCPVVVTIPDMMFELFPDYDGAVRSRPYKVFKWCTRRRVRRVICPSQTSADDLARLWGISRRRIDVVPHGLRIFHPDAGPTAASEKAVQTTESIISSPLNLEPRKNLISLLEAFAILHPRFPKVRLLLYGKGGWSAEREAKYRADLERLKLAGSVHETGVLSDPDLWSLYCRSTLFVLPTLYEGFGYPALEAMAAGTCCVVRGCSAMAEIVGPAGVQVEPFTPDGLAEAIASLLVDEPRRRRLAQEARRRAGLFGSERMARGTFNSYTRCLRLAKVGT